MKYRFTLSHEAYPDKVISEPQGFEKAELKLLRHEDFHSLVEYYEGEFIFYGADQFDDGGIDYIREVELNYGHDADLRITIEVAPDGYTFQTLFVGLLKLSEIEELPDNKMQVPVIRDDFWSKFINRQETQVDIQSDSNLDNESADQFDSVNIRLSSQTIRQVFQGYWSTSVQIGPMLSEDYVQLDFDVIDFDEIQEKFTYPVTYNSERPFELFAMEYAGDYNFIPTISLSYVRDDQSDSRVTDSLFDVYIQVNEDAVIPLTPTNFNLGGGYFFTRYYTEQSLSLKVGDAVRLYVQGNGDDGNYTLWVLGQDDNEFLGPPEFESSEIETSLEVIGQTIFPESNCSSFLIHDAGGQICDRIIGQDSSFYSEILGSTQTVYRQYDEDGCFWHHVEAKGLQIRRYSLFEKPFFQSFKQWWEGVNPIFNLGLGYEEFNGQQIIRVEDKRHFYDSEVSMNISNVRDIVRKYDSNRLFKAIKIGYKKWQAEDVSGIDDPQTKKTYATRLQKSGKDITIESEFIAASLAIETTRRKTREKSADYKFDNDTFIISIRPDSIHVSPETSPDVTDYEPELDENFSSVDNLLNPETRYNIRLTPARNFLRWREWLSAGLQSYPSDPFKFTAGEGNYDVITTSEELECDNYVVPLSEKQDIGISTDPFHLALMYEIRVPMTWDEYATIRDNRKKAIGISQTEEDHVKFFIQELSYTPEKGEAVIMAWPEELLQIVTIESESTGQVCFDSCEDVYLTEDGFEFETEDENCLVLN